MKVEKLKTMLKKMLVEFARVSTDKGLLSYESEGELPEIGENIYIVDEEGNEEVAENGEYRTEADDVIVVEDGKVAEIRKANDEVVVEEPVEEVVEELEDVEVIEPVEPEPVDEVIDVIPEDEPKEEDALEARLAAIEARLTAIEERLAALEAEPVVDSAEETFKKVNNLKKTGNERMDRLNKILGATIK